jgi:hypothetical protein
MQLADHRATVRRGELDRRAQSRTTSTDNHDIVSMNHL